MDPRLEHHPLFSPASNRLVLYIVLAAMFAVVYAITLLCYAGNAETLNVGYSPAQPVPFSHAMHVGKLGLNCEYCHNTVERAAFAAVPPAQTCMNCHLMLFPHADALRPVRQSYFTGKPVPWVRIDNLPKYVFFNHAAHVRAGVSCLTCHGQVNHMDQVAQVKPLNMAWCLQCHRHPYKHLRPRDEVTHLDWKTNANRETLGHELYKKYHLRVSTDCITCHR